MTDTLATAPVSEAPAAAPVAAPAGGTAAPAPVDAGGGAPVTPTPGAAGTPTTPSAAAPAPSAAALVTPPGETPKAEGDTNWRAAFAQGDPELEKRLNRFASPNDFVKSYKALEAKMSSGELKRAAPGPDATPEEVKAWRAESGIPEAPEGYFEKIELPTGVTLGEADKPFANSFAEYAHKEHMTPKQVSAAMAWYYDTLDKQTIGTEERDATHKVQSRDALHSEWRGDFKANMNAAQSVIQTAPEDVRSRLFGGRTADGSIIGNDPAVLKWLANLGREINPAATLLPPGISDAGKGLNDRIAQIEGLMKAPDNAKVYWGNQAVQEEYRNLVTARDKLQARK